METLGNSWVPFIPRRWRSEAKKVTLLCSLPCLRTRDMQRNDSSDPPDEAARRESSLVVLRGVVALIFLAHAVVRLMNGSAPGFAEFLEAKGFPLGFPLVLAISLTEITCGLLLLAGVFLRCACILLGVIVVCGVWLIHAANGWFVGEHGIGGMEFSVLLCAALLVVGMSGQTRKATRYGHGPKRG